MMAAAKIPNATNIDDVTAGSVASLQPQVQVANFNPYNEIYIDDVKGNFPSGYTAIEEVKAEESVEDLEVDSEEVKAVKKPIKKK